MTRRYKPGEPRRVRLAHLRRRATLREQATRALRRCANFLWVAREEWKRNEPETRSCAGYTFASSRQTTAWCLQKAADEWSKRERLQAELGQEA